MLWISNPSDRRRQPPDFIRRYLGETGYPPAAPDHRRTAYPAAVALILLTGPAGLEMLFIERARHDDDPWSGNLGFPGGKVEETDDGERQAAERETREEIGLDLAFRPLPRQGSPTSPAPICRSGFLFRLRAGPPPRWS